MKYTYQPYFIDISIFHDISCYQSTKKYIGYKILGN